MDDPSIAYRCGGSAGLVRSLGDGPTGFPFHLAHGGERHLKQLFYKITKPHSASTARLTDPQALRSLPAFEVLHPLGVQLRGNRVNALAAPATVNGSSPFDRPLPMAGR
ncbi:hypothetical protein D3C78_1113540 [compost metagenome]